MGLHRLSVCITGSMKAFEQYGAVFLLLFQLLHDCRVVHICSIVIVLQLFQVGALQKQLSILDSAKLCGYREIDKLTLYLDSGVEFLRNVLRTLF